MVPVVKQQLVKVTCVYHTETYAKRSSDLTRNGVSAEGKLTFRSIGVRLRLMIDRTHVAQHLAFLILQFPFTKISVPLDMSDSVSSVFN